MVRECVSVHLPFMLYYYNFLYKSQISLNIGKKEASTPVLKPSNLDNIPMCVEKGTNSSKLNKHGKGIELYINSF